MCNQFTFHHQLRIDTWRSKFEQTTDSILSACESHGQETTRILIRSTWMHRVMHNTCIKHGRNIRTRCIRSTSILLRGKDWSSIRHDRTPSFFTKHSQLIVSRKLFGWKLEKSKTKSVCVTWASSKDFLKHDWMKELGSEVARQAEDNQPTQPNPNPIFRTGRPVVCKNTSRSSNQEKSIHFFHRDSTNFNLEEKTNHDGTGRPVVSRQPVGSSSTINEVDIDFSNLQADLQHEKSKKMIKDMGNVEQFELCETKILKCTAKNAFFTGIKTSFVALAGIPWKIVKPAEAPFNGHWIFSQFKIMSLRRGGPSWPSIWED